MNLTSLCQSCSVKSTFPLEKRGHEKSLQLSTQPSDPRQRDSWLTRAASNKHETQPLWRQCHWKIKLTALENRLRQTDFLVSDLLWRTSAEEKGDAARPFGRTNTIYLGCPSSAHSHSHRYSYLTFPFMFPRQGHPRHGYCNPVPIISFIVSEPRGVPSSIMDLSGSRPVTATRTRDPLHASTPDLHLLERVIATKTRPVDTTIAI